MDPTFLSIDIWLGEWNKEIYWLPRKSWLLAFSWGLVGTVYSSLECETRELARQMVQCVTSTLSEHFIQTNRIYSYLAVFSWCMNNSVAANWEWHRIFKSLITLKLNKMRANCSSHLRQYKTKQKQKLTIKMKFMNVNRLIICPVTLVTHFTTYWNYFPLSCHDLIETYDLIWSSRKIILLMGFRFSCAFSHSRK